jgi:sodium-dependent phosphate transporter
MGVGARVADTIRTKVVDVKQFENNPPLLMLGMVCAVTGSSVFLTIATRFGMPVSTTHSILGGVIGMGIATVGRDGIHWWGGNINSGVVQVFLAWIFAPLLSGAFASIIFLLTKYGILLRKNAVMKALITVPIYFGITAALLTSKYCLLRLLKFLISFIVLIVWKGGSSRISLNDAESAGVIVGVGAGVALLVGIFFVPWLYRVVIKGDAKLRWYQIPLGPMLLKRPEPTVPDSGVVVRDFYSGHKTREEVLADRGLASNDVDDVEGNANVSSTVAPTIESPTGVDLSDNEKTASNSDRKPGATDARIRGPHEDHIHHSIIGQRPEGAALSVAVLFWQFKRIIFHGVDQNVLVEQNKANFLTGDLNEIHSHAAHFDNNTEYMFTFLQAMVAATASFAHGANDVAK